MKTEQCHITIVEPHKQFGEAIKNFLESKQEFEGVRFFSSVMELDSLEAKKPFPNVLIIDTKVLQGEDLDKFRLFTYLHPSVTTIALSMQDNIPSLGDIIGLGFKGYIRREDVYTQLIPVIQCTLMGKYHFKGHFDCGKID